MIFHIEQASEDTTRLCDEAAADTSHRSPPRKFFRFYQENIQPAF